jgi:hypothetical protein
MVSAFALVAALAVQGYNFNRNAALQREANEETEWREMLASLSLPGNAGADGAVQTPASGPRTLLPISQLVAVQLKSFLDSPSSRHKRDAAMSRFMCSRGLPTAASAARITDAFRTDRKGCGNAAF